MPKCPRSSGPVRKELGCWTDIAALRSRTCAVRGRARRIAARRQLRIGRAGGTDEGANHVGILLAGGALDARGYIEAVRPGDAERLADIAGIETARKYERNAQREILQEAPIESLAETARTAGLARRPRIEHDEIGHLLIA